MNLPENLTPAEKWLVKILKKKGYTDKEISNEITMQRRIPKEDREQICRLMAEKMVAITDEHEMNHD